MTQTEKQAMIDVFIAIRQQFINCYQLVDIIDRAITSLEEEVPA